jgi:hypothetical protein
MLNMFKIAPWGVLLTAITLSSTFEGFVEAADQPVQVEKRAEEEQKEEHQWNLISSADGVTTWSQDIPNSQIVAFKGETIMDAPLPKVAAVLDDTTRQLEWVANAMEAKDLATYNRFERLIYNCTRTPWPLMNRDFVFKTAIELDRASQTMTVRMKSVADPQHPPREDRVRGWMNNSLYVLTAIDGGKKTRISVEIHADPRGDVPKWAVNLFQKGWPRQTLEGIRRQVAKADVVELTQLRDYFFGPVPPTQEQIAAAISTSPTPLSTPAPSPVLTTERDESLRTSQAAALTGSLKSETSNPSPKPTPENAPQKP